MFQHIVPICFANLALKATFKVFSIKKIIMKKLFSINAPTLMKIQASSADLLLAIMLSKNF